jgi:hypothetical protein
MTTDPGPEGRGAECGSIHPKELGWHCECKERRHHPGNHRCYGCGFEWEQGNPHSRMPDETDDTIFDLLGGYPDA